MRDTSQRWVLIIPAAGKGLRYGATGPPKQFLQVSGRSLLTHSVCTALSVPRITSIFLAVPEEAITDTEALLIRELPRTDDGAQHLPSALDPRVTIVAGGASRQESVALALRAITPDDADLVFVHDAVRPLATAELYERVGVAAMTYGATIPCIALSDTIKEVRDGVVVSTPSRSHFRRVQTPQAFAPDILIAAHARAIERGIHGTDDSSLVELFGATVHCVNGEETNVKVTTPSDLQFVEWMLSLKS